MNATVEAMSELDALRAENRKLRTALAAINLRGRNVGAEHDLAEYEAALGECCQIARTAIRSPHHPRLESLAADCGN